VELFVGSAEASCPGFAGAVLILLGEVAKVRRAGLEGLTFRAVLVQASGVEVFLFPGLGKLLAAGFLLRGGCAVASYFLFRGCMLVVLAHLFLLLVGKLLGWELLWHHGKTQRPLPPVTGTTAPEMYEPASDASRT
jgi:hypothetical protein